MKNKKGMSAVVTTLIVILLVIVALMIIWVVVKNVLEPPFKITKEECSKLGKECSTNGGKNCIDFCLRVHINESNLEKNNYTNSMYERVWKCINFNNCCEDDCEKVEVEYILGEANGCTGECYDKENSKCICLNDFHTKYYKKDLSIEWLDENCEDITPCRKDYEGEIICDNPIKEYKCEFEETYFVEVIK